MSDKSNSEEDLVQPRKKSLLSGLLPKKKERTQEEADQDLERHKEHQSFIKSVSQSAAQTIVEKGARLAGMLKKSKENISDPTARRKIKKSEHVQLQDMQEGDREAAIDDDVVESKFNGKDLSTMVEHTMPIAEVAQLYGTHIDTKRPLDSKGLSTDDAAALLKRFGPNVVVPPKKTSRWVKLLEAMTNLFNILLFAGGVMYIILYLINPDKNYETIWIGLTLIIVGFLNAGIEFYELIKIANILESFSGYIASQSFVIRDGKRIVVSAAQLVPGDVVFLRAGDKVPADCILFWGNDLRVDGSNLTGESEPFSRVPKHEGVPQTTDPFDSPHVLFNSDVIVTGEGFAIVTQTGQKSSIGKINSLTRNLKQRRSTLAEEIKRFSKTITLLAFCTAFVFFFVALARVQNFNYAITFGIGIIIAWVPQGLPLTVTLILAISGRRMTDQQVLVKDLHGLETLGGITLLATDKTGTLTKNKMTAIQVWLNGFMYFCGKTVPPGSKQLKLDVSGVAQLMHVCVTCSRAKFDRNDVPIDERVIIGDATEAGLLSFAAKRLNNIDRLGDMYPKIFEVPFSSETKYHLTIHRKSHANGGITLHIKGAPEVIKRLCSSVWVEGKIVQWTDEEKLKFDAACVDMAQNGIRVIACAIMQLPGTKYPDNYKFDATKANYPQEGYTMLGLVGLEDPPKEEVRGAIEKIKSAGIKTVMITGDNPMTAEAIAKQTGMIKGNVIRVLDATSLPIKAPTDESIVLVGSVINDLTDTDWLNILNHETVVFARTLPFHKLELVKRAQALGHIVAVTGDGVNDSAALKRADLGIAMNKTGSDMSKDSARMILLDDNFASTVRGIQEGRLIFINLKKAIKYSLSHIIPEVMPYLLYVLVPIPLAITPSQILVVDLGFELLLTLSFAWEPAEDQELLMSVPPRKQVTKETTKRMLEIQMEKESYLHQSRMQLNDEDAHDSQLLVDQDINGLNDRLQKKYLTHLNEFKRGLTDKEYWIAEYNEWKALTALPSGERLVDGEVMLWSFIEVGFLEFCGCLAAYVSVLWFSFGISYSDAVYMQSQGSLYFKPKSPDFVLQSGQILSGPDQYEALRQAQSAVYLSIFIIQVFNLFACKTRYTMLLGARVLHNQNTWKSIAAGLTFACLVVYTPPTNALFLTSLYLNPLHLLIPLSVGAFLYVYSVVRRFILKQCILTDNR
ncbi:hypothetical protein EDD86DRAFT_223758 [Gorgonomyces haynaldii]|nr:hypothetical protein EDD86DRAFT_223758 [Gorgonomyces haynaldii]